MASPSKNPTPQLLTIAEAAELAGLTPKAMRRRIERGREAPRNPHAIHAKTAGRGTRRRRVLVPYSELERVGLVKNGVPVNGRRSANGDGTGHAKHRIGAEGERRSQVERERDDALEELAHARRLLAEIAVASPWRRRGLLRLARLRYGSHLSDQ
jgi:hypothetical protein